MDSRTKFFIIANPTAGRGRTLTFLPALEQLLREQKLSYELRLTSAPGDAVTLAQEGIREGFECVVAVGGDGTAHEVAQALVGTTVTLGIIPTGSGNDFCKATSVPLDLASAVGTLVVGRERLVDVAKSQSHFIVNGLGIGLDGAVSHRYRRMKRLRGELGYLWGAIHEALTFRAHGLELRTPDWQFRGQVLLAGVSNGPYHGGNFKLTPDAQVDDGLLDIYIIRDMHPLRRLLHIPKVRRGTHVHLEEVEIRRTPWVDIHCDSSCPAHMDGEPFQMGPGPYRLEILPRSLHVISSH